MPQRLFALLAAASSLLFCATSDAKNQHSCVDNNQLGVLNEAAAIASEHRLNVDDTPEFVTVWHRLELRALGVTDLFEALSLVPGIQTSIIQNGIQKVVMMGHNTPGNMTFDRFKLIVYWYIIETAEVIKVSTKLRKDLECALFTQIWSYDEIMGSIVAKNLFDKYIADISYYGRHDGIVRPAHRWFVAFEYQL